MKQKTISEDDFYEVTINEPRKTTFKIMLPFYGANRKADPDIFIFARRVNGIIRVIKIAKSSTFDGWITFADFYIQYMSYPNINEFYPIEKVEFDMAFASFVESISNI